MLEEIKTAIFHYCHYQERSHAEVRNKLYELGCNSVEVEQHIADLIQKDIVNEERYAKAIARGKFRMKQWGRQKIIQQLKLQKISAYCIKKALKEIDPNEYQAVLTKLAGKKWEALKKERSENVRKHKVYRYLLQKGYESDIINDTIKEIIKPAD